MSSKRKGVSPLVSVALLMIVVLAASSVLASNINMSPYLPPEDVEKNRLLESVAIVDVLEDAVNTPPGTVKVTVYIFNNGLISANISAIYIGDPVGNLVQANTSVNRIVSAGEAIGIVFYRPTAVNWTTFLAVTARGNFASFLLGSDNTQTPDYLYIPGFMIGYEGQQIPLEGPPYTAESLETILEYIHETLDPDYVESHAYYTSNGVRLRVTGDKLTMQLSNKADGEGVARFLFYNPSSDVINISIVRETNANEHFNYLDVYFYNFSSNEYELARHITDGGWSKDDIEHILITDAQHYIQDSLFDMKFVLNDDNSGSTQFKFNIVLDSTTSAYAFNAEYIVTLSDPDPSVSYVRGVLFELSGVSNIPGNYSLWLYNYSSGIYDLKLMVTNSSGAFDSMYLTETENSYFALYQGNVFDYLNANYELKYMIAPDFELDQNLVLSFSSMHVQLFMQSLQQSPQQ
jgi:hypothetical protein